MKTQISKPSAGKTLFTAEYKEEAVNHWKESGRSAATVAAELGIRAPLLYRWAQQLRLTAQQGGQPELKRSPDGVRPLHVAVCMGGAAREAWDRRSYNSFCLRPVWRRGAARKGT
jgi:hypothetical protein